MILDFYATREESRKSWEYVVTDKIVHAVHDINIDCNPLGRITENNGTWIEVHGDFGHSQWKMHFISIIEWMKSHVRLLGSQMPLKTDVQSMSTKRKATMLVNDVQFMELPEQATFKSIAITCLVRLKFFYYRDCIVRDALGLSSEKAVIRLFKNRPLNFCAIGSCMAINDHKPINKVIEGGTERMCEISSEDGYSFDGIEDLNPDDMERLFKIIVSRDGVGFRILEDFKIPLERFQMFVRPFGPNIDVPHGA